MKKSIGIFLFVFLIGAFWQSSTTVLADRKEGQVTVIIESQEETQTSPSSSVSETASTNKKYKIPTENTTVQSKKKLMNFLPKTNEQFHPNFQRLGLLSILVSLLGYYIYNKRNGENK